MATNLTAVDLQALADSRLAEQYKQSPNLRGMIAAFVAESADAQATFLKLLDEWNLDDATGVALDVIGEIVGYERPLIDGGALSYFGFTNTLNYPSATNAELGFGSLTNPAVGGRLRSITEPATGQIPLSDPEYRRMIRAKILRNNTSATPPEVIEVIKTAFPLIEPVTLEEQGSANVLITFGRSLNTVETQLLQLDSVDGRTDDRLVPLPIAVAATYANGSPSPFGFVDETTPDPSILGFGDLSQTPGPARGRWTSIAV